MPVGTTFTRQVCTRLLFGHYSFETQLTSGLEKGGAIALDKLARLYEFRGFEDIIEALLALNQRLLHH